MPRAVALAEVKDDFSKYLPLAAQEEIVITRHGRPAGLLIGFASEEDWFEYRIEHHPEFLRRVADAGDLRASVGIDTTGGMTADETMVPRLVTALCDPEQRAMPRFLIVAVDAGRGTG